MQLNDGSDDQSQAKTYERRVESKGKNEKRLVEKKGGQGGGEGAINRVKSNNKKCHQIY